MSEPIVQQLGALYANDFGAFSPGAGLPAGFTSRWSSSNIAFSVQAEAIAGAISGQEMKFNSTSNANRMVSLDAAGQPGDCEVLASLYISGLGTGANYHGGVSLRATESVDGYNLQLQTTGGVASLLRMSKLTAGTFTTLGDASFSWAINTRYWLRFRARGALLQGRVWQRGNAEPTTWNLTRTDADYASGYAGLFDQHASSDAAFDYIAVRAGVGSAPPPA